MEYEKYRQQRVAVIQVADYLARWAVRKFDIDPQTGGIRIPQTFDLYHCVWHLMERRPRNLTAEPVGNLKIWLPARRAEGHLAQKNPAIWNYLSPRRQHVVEQQLRRLFSYEFHMHVEQELLRGVQKTEAVRNYIRLYRLGLDCEDTLLKNLQRHERALREFLGHPKD